MPTPGPRNQFGPDPGHRNPGLEQPDRFNHWDRPGPIWWPGRSPGLMFTTLRGNVLAAGQIRQLWRQAVNYIGAQTAYSWTRSAPSPDRPVRWPGGFHITRALRYKTGSVYLGAGLDHSRYDALHTVIRKQNVYKTVTVNSGQQRNRPTIRNRMTSFGARVPALNESVDAAESQSPGAAAQA